MAYPMADTMFQILDPNGRIVGELPDLPDEQLVDFYRWMVLGRLFSDRAVALQRQGRLGTVAPLSGQEATSLALATALQPGDWLLGTYRDLLGYIVKGVPMTTLLNTYQGRIVDSYPRAANCLPFQIVLAAQALHGVGIAMAMQYEAQPQVVVVAIGDGATSEGEFHEALNFAAVYKAPVVFVVQNNGWAISVPRSVQTASEYIAHRGPAFGMPGHVVDGMDVLACHQVIGEAVAHARAGNGPSLVEAINYRLGAHTTADDPTKYRDEAEVSAWQQLDPLTRYRTFLEERSLLTKALITQIEDGSRAQIQAAVDEVEAMSPQDPAQYFDVFYATPHSELIQQRKALLHEIKAAEKGVV